MGEVKVLALCGSLRKGSINRGLLVAAQEVAPPGLSIEIFEGIGDIPHYNQDADVDPAPPAVQRLRDAIREANGILIATPEYNYGIPGVLKNAIDWASRPVQTTSLRGKPIALMGASGGMSGTIRAQLQLRQNLVFTQTPVMLSPEVLIPRAMPLYTDGRLTDESTRELIRKAMLAFELWIQRFVPEPSATQPWARSTGAMAAQK